MTCDDGSALAGGWVNTRLCYHPHPMDHPFFRFGVYELHPQSSELLRGGRRVHLPLQSIKLLTLLIERQGELVTRDEIRLALWGDETIVAFDTAVNACVSQIRSALGDRPTAPRFVETLPRRGYRFVGPVERIDRRAPAAAEAAPPPCAIVPATMDPPADRPRRRAVAWAAAAAGALAVTASAVYLVTGTPAVVAAGTTSTVALARFEQAVLAFRDASPMDLLDRIEMLESALEADGRFARAHAAMAEGFLMLGQYRGLAPQDAYARAKAAATRALQLDPQLGEAHAAYGAAVLYLEWDRVAAEAHLAKAARASRSNPDVLYWRSRWHAASGDPAAALRLARHAVALAPDSARLRANLGVAAFHAGDFGRALTACEEAIALLPAYTPARHCAIAAAEEAGDYARALAHLEQLDSEDRDGTERLRRALASSGAAGYWRSRLETLERANCDEQAMSIAVVRAHLGDADGAFRSLQRAADLHAASLLFLRVHPGLAALRGDPRFSTLLRRTRAE